MTSRTPATDNSAAKYTDYVTDDGWFVIQQLNEDDAWIATDFSEEVRL